MLPRRPDELRAISRRARRTMGYYRTGDDGRLVVDRVDDVGVPAR